jgi:hypothetical protein
VKSVPHFPRAIALSVWDAIPKSVQNLQATPTVIENVQVAIQEGPERVHIRLNAPARKVRLPTGRRITGQ